MKKIIIAIVVCFSGLGVLSVHAQADEHEKPIVKDVTLTEQQKEELAVLYEDMINQKKGIIAKYTTFGVLTEENATKMTEHLDQYLEKLHADGFIPKWHGPKSNKKQLSN